MAARALVTTGGREGGRRLEQGRPGEMWRTRPGDPGRRTETRGDTTRDPGRKIRLEGKEAQEEKLEDLLAEAAVEAVVEVGEEDFPAEVGDVADVVEDLKSEVGIRREGKIGDVGTVASETLLTGLNVTSVRTPSQTNLPRPTPLRTRGTRSRQ